MGKMRKREGGTEWGEEEVADRCAGLLRSGQGHQEEDFPTTALREKKESDRMPARSRDSVALPHLQQQQCGVMLSPHSATRTPLADPPTAHLVGGGEVEHQACLLPRWSSSLPTPKMVDCLA